MTGKATYGDDRRGRQEGADFFVNREFSLQFEGKVPCDTNMRTQRVSFLPQVAQVVEAVQCAYFAAGAARRAAKISGLVQVPVLR